MFIQYIVPRNAPERQEYHTLETENKTQLRSIRTSVTLTMVISFVIVVVVMFIIFALSMQNMLLEREADYMRNQTDMARNMLLMSTDGLPNTTREWASLTYTHDYVTGADDLIYHTHFSPDESYVTNQVNLLAVLDADDNLMFQKFYNYGEGRQIEHDVDLQDIYVQLANATWQNYVSAVNSDNPMSHPLGMDGFVAKDGYVYYVSAHPIANIRSDLPWAGTFVFGRIIDGEELGAMTNNTGVSFSVHPIANLPLGEADKQTLADTGAYFLADANVTTSYASLDDVNGAPTLAVSVTSERTLYSQGWEYINLVLFITALGCATVVLVTINLLGRIVLDPLGSLAQQVDHVDIEASGAAITGEFKNQEMSRLKTAINNMLGRIQADRHAITEANDSLYYSANFDALTGMRNRRSLTMQLDEDLEPARQSGKSISLFYFDLYRFKYINDTMGHQAGDYLIAQISGRLGDTFGEGVVLGRMSGDKFIAYTDALHDKADRQRFVGQIEAVFAEPFTVKERSLDLTVSIGSSVYPDDGQDAETLIKNAEIAMYHSKGMGSGLYTPYQAELQKSLHQRIYIENKLRAAINDDCREFEVYFQPKVQADTGEINKCEALVRWMAPGGIISPNDFIPQAEESGLVVPLTWWILRECCVRGKQFADAGIPMSISINVPAQVLTHDEFIAHIQDAVAATGMDITKLDIEITEGTLLEDMDNVNKVLHSLHTLGIQISVDDFGTGYSSLSYLHRLSIDRIKIDRSFVSVMDMDEDCRAIVRAVVAMAKGLQMIVTAEGVETEEQYELLRQMDCEEIQGFLISKPVPVEEYIHFSREWNNRHTGSV